MLDSAFKSNSKQNGDEKGMEDAEADPEEEPLAPQAQSNIVNICLFLYPHLLNISFRPQLQLLCFHRIHASAVSGQKKLARELPVLDASIANV